VLLRVKGIGKILDSQIEMDGITVIAGENNTGKSTFGKALYCMFNAFCNAEKNIYDERVKDIRRIIYDDPFSDDFGIRLNEKVIDRILSLKESFSEDAFFEVIKEYFVSIPESGMRRLKGIVHRSVDELERSITIANDDIQQTIITRYFRNEFEGQINHLNRGDLSGEVSLTIKKESVDITIEANECCAFSDRVGIQHDSIYIDSPFVIDNVQQYYRRGIPPHVPFRRSSQIGFGLPSFEYYG
jgi:hypothetical protein